MRILLNLVPSEKKERLARRFQYRFFSWQLILIFAFVLYYLLILGGIYMTIMYQVKTENGQLKTTLEEQRNAESLDRSQERFKEANLQIRDIDRYFKEHLNWSRLLSLLGEVTDETIAILGVTTKDYTVSLSGQARTRGDFLRFEDNLKGSECVSDVKVPLSNLFSKTEIEFQVDFNVNRECLLTNTP